MIRTANPSYEDSKGIVQDLKVTYEVISSGEEVEVKILKVETSDAEFVLTEEIEEELKEFCWELYDDDNWEYESD